MANELKITLSLDGGDAVVKGIERVNGSSESAKKSLVGWKSAVADFAHVGQSILLVKAAFDRVAGSVVGVASAMLDAQQTVQKLQNSLTYSAGSAAGAATELAYLRDVSRSLGLDFTSASAAYAKFAAATKGSGVSAAQTKIVFEGVAQASARMGLSADETSGALLALSQTLALHWQVKKIAAVAAMVGAIGYCVFSGAEVATVRSLIQTIGRAARHVNGKAILYADVITDSS